MNDIKLIACETMRDEINMVMKDESIMLETIWMDNTLHAYPEKLKVALQETIDHIDAQGDTKTILFAYGNCGNGLVGLKSQTAELIIPKYADCIGIFLNREEDLERMRTRTYFLTRGWLDGKKGLEWEIEYNRKRYGEKRANQIIEMLYKNYESLMLIDTGAYDVEPATQRTEKIAEALHMKPIVHAGDTTPLKKLIIGEWDEHFVRKMPGEAVGYQDFE